MDGSSVRAASAALAAVAVLVVAAPAQAATYTGAVDGRGETLEAVVTDDAVAEFRGSTGLMQTCAEGSVGSTGQDANHFELAQPVAITDRSFQLSGTTTSDWGHPLSWTASGRLSRNGLLAGTISMTGDMLVSKGCRGTWRFEAIVPPKPARRPTRFNMSSDNSGEWRNASRVEFKLRRKRITHLSVAATITCASGSEVGASYLSTAYRDDPLRLRRDRSFRLRTYALTFYGTVMHLDISGRVSNQRVATGRVQASTYKVLRGRQDRCREKLRWRAHPPVRQAPCVCASVAGRARLAVVASDSLMA